MTDDIDLPSRPSTPSPNDRIKKSKVRRSLTPALLAAQSSKKKTPSTPARRTASSPLRSFSSIESTTIKLYANSAFSSAKTTKTESDDFTEAVQTTSEKIDKKKTVFGDSDEDGEDEEIEGGRNNQTSVKEREEKEIKVEKRENNVSEVEIFEGNAGSNAKEEVVTNDEGVGGDCGEQSRT